MRFSSTTLAIITLLGVAVTVTRAENRHDGRGDRPRVTFYEHADFRGASRTVEAGEVLENLTRARFSNGGEMNDRISSIRIEGGAQVLLYQDAGFRGDTRRIDFSVSNLNDSAPGWNDAVSSLRVERDRGGRGDRGDRVDHGPDRHDGPDFRRTDDIVRRAYRDILRREPDAGGLRDYRRHMMQDNWSEAQVRHSLRESEEFRNLADGIITSAYRDLLGRDASHRERSKFREQMVQRGASEEDVRRAIRATDEYRMRQKNHH
jgi:hypothetical protein